MTKEEDKEGPTQRLSYRDTQQGKSDKAYMEIDSYKEDSDASDDDSTKEEEEGPWFTIGMSKQEKFLTRKPWRTSLIIKLIGRKIGYQYLLKRIQSLWRVQSSTTLIDLPNNFFVVLFASREE